MRTMLGMAMAVMASANSFGKDTKEYHDASKQANALAYNCCYANPEYGQFFATKGKFKKLKGWKRVQLGLTHKRKK